ncbi:MAG: hypothetical protein H7X94_01505, partial [Vallitaleaceae bacterium]|nr:hypothetical protein [Vallitaleaceae bacterium]
VSQAAVIFLLGFLLDFVKFDSKLVVQPASTVNILGMTIAVGSFLSFTLAMIVYRKYTLNAQKVSEIQKQILIRKNENIIQ